VATLDEVLFKNWWTDMTPTERKQRLAAVDTQDDEAGRRKAWNHHNETKEAERSQHPSMGMPIPKD